MTWPSCFLGEQDVGRNVSRPTCTARSSWPNQCAPRKHKWPRVQADQVLEPEIVDRLQAVQDTCLAAPLPSAATEDAAPAGRAGTDAWVGVAVATGQATGKAQVLRHPSEGNRLRPGEILVAPSTDPGWTPLFLRAAAVVMEVGGYQSHGAIVEVATGDTLFVDGDAGIVRKLDPGPNETL